MVSVYQEIEVDLAYIDDADLLDELESRGKDLNSKYVSGDEVRRLLTAVYEKRLIGKDFQQDLDELIYYALGRIV